MSISLIFPDKFPFGTAENALSEVDSGVEMFSLTSRIFDELVMNKARANIGGPAG